MMWWRMRWRGRACDTHLLSVSVMREGPRFLPVVGLFLAALSAGPVRSQSASGFRPIGGLHLGAPLGVSGFRGGAYARIRGQGGWSALPVATIAVGF